MGLLKRFPRMSMLTIGERLRAYRESKAISQKEMQKRLGLSRYYISRIENGHSIPKLETLKRFADASEVLLFHLVYEDGDLRPPFLPRAPKSLVKRSSSCSRRVQPSVRQSKQAG
jgi:transcriptional regulator with XRE-family HTH domain